MVDLCIYHADCMDGFTAAWTVKKRHPEVELLAAKYDDTPPYVEGLDVAIVDFSYSYEKMADMAKVADSLLILDHHESAFAAVAKLNNDFDNVTVEFDIDRSGAALAWEFFHGKSSGLPLLVELTQDYDLWKFELVGTKQLHAYQTSLLYDIKAWNEMHQELENKGSLASIFLTGGGIMRAQTRQVKALIESSSYISEAFGHKVPFLNCPRVWKDEAGSLMASPDGVPFAVRYSVLGDRIEFSLRSSQVGLDVQELAKLFGGGGHKHAAGFWVEKRGSHYTSGKASINF